jgi:hypothetical protein
MVLAMRHGVLGYEAMGLNCLFPIFAFGVFNYAATRIGSQFGEGLANDGWI